MNKLLLKDIIILSLIIGVIFGVIASIPYVGGIGLFLMLLLSAPIVIILVIMSGKADLSSPKDSIITGATVGFFSNITFSFVYAVVVALLYFIGKFTSNYFLTSMIIHSPIWLFIVVVLFIGTLTATTNAFSGFITYYVINLIRDLYEKKYSNKE